MDFSFIKELVTSVIRVVNEIAGGNWLESLVGVYKQDDVRFNVKQLTVV